ncbi:molybdopterin-guanine dinucleotide biosynthesis protein B [Thalassobacillus sp. CUG 92003]|uniref:molybdopterin-guanine dinucleotide biosynthesis protein B n=1 Tax=Thalassobacillus sp. CUG 92003 TaxID=2736641 RepID=UPI0015E6BC29|nr:molybdopterin-guanine dinucleotide biosynthesis protein B [Thalassobacillus sp. CUG 92003]
MNNPNVFQIVGHKNTGKTRVLSHLITYAQQAGDAVSVIKHHGHTTSLETSSKSPDSQRLHKSGSFMTTVHSPDALQFDMEHKGSVTLEHVLSFYSYFNPDIILIEGYKHKHYPKLLIIRNEEDLSLLNELTNVKGVICWSTDLVKNDQLPVFQMNEIEVQLPHIYKLIKEGGCY